MKIRYERPVSHAASWARRIGLFTLLLFLITALLHRLGMMAPTTVAILLALSGCLAVLTLLLSVTGLVRLWMVGAKGGVASTKGLFLSIVVLVPVGLLAFRFYTLPPLYDISTDLDDAPEFLEPISRNAPAFAGFGAAADKGQAEAYPRVTGRRYEGAMDRVLEAVRQVAKDNRIHISRVATLESVPGPEEDEGSVVDEAESALPEDTEANAAAVILLQGETTNLILGLEADVSIRLSEEAETTYVDIRSVTRSSPHDLGTNADMIITFLAALDSELLGIAVR